MHCDVPNLWLEHKDALRNYIRKRVPDEAQAADLLQDVLLKVYGFCQARSGVANVRSWLFQITQNAIVDAARKNRRLRPLDEGLDVEAESESEAYQEAAEYILPMIQLLPPTYAEPLRLADVEGMKQQDIAQQLGLGLSATKSRIQRGREMLRDVFTECCLLETDAQGHLLGFAIRSDCGSLQTYKQTLEKK
ncbi:sigma-70 family RNA polymerase sigma factor [Hymenobacter sp. HDW8]|uniref:sigma-70 family RNA polymerase sigma factor n=1 Tax=Hymenobacter sp. HDW8 TaxID=2714932 RepID=UPI00140AD9AD|nr:sigma-70 family RNA polymerase sigma factor [Hymenobacter sp. HDW8]QIL76562.1 sigma-70 family RNA polymerase sigma factor [Hymenobacter sp. HDW8]